MNSYMRKRASSGGKNLKYDFMPSMIEIIENCVLKGRGQWKISL